jgi:multidrug efflux pump
MLSRFFIDRPIFATVLSVVITLIGLAALVNLPIAQYPRITPPGVVVSISYPGANAQVVAQTVAAPIEQQVTGVPGMLYMSSQSGNDGSYSLSCTFDVNTDLNAALVMVQNRVTLAMPLLPTQVQRQGITIRKRTPDILLIANFTSPDSRYDDIYLSNFVLINIRDELLRVDGVSDANILGERDYSIRAWLDPQKLSSRSITAGDVVAAIQAQNIEAPVGQVGQAPARRTQAFQQPIDTLGRLRDPTQFADIVVKTGSNQALSAAVAPTASSPASSSGSSSGGIGNPLAAAAALSPTGTSTTSTASGLSSSSSQTSTTSTSPTGTASTSSSAGSTGISTGTTSSGTGPTGSTTSSGGGTTSGGAQSAGGGTTGGAATGSTISQAPNYLTVGGASSTGDETGAISATSTGQGPRAPATAIVRLGDVARVEMGALNYNQSAYFDGLPSVGVAVYQLPDTNALDVADRVKGRLAELSTRFPDGIAYTVGYDTTPFIRESITEVYRTLFYAILLVAAVVLFFLQDWKAMILPMIDVPVSLIGTFAIMAGLGYSLNNISLFGLVLAIGIVVDDAIVVLENIERQMARGLDARSGTLKAMEEITGPIIAITLVLSAVFIPCAFISGITGRFFRQFAVTIAASTIISALNALTMTPSRALLILRQRGRQPIEGPHPTQKKEALPWWIFGAAGGWLAYDYGADLVSSAIPDQRLATSVTVTVGLITGAVLGWFLIRPVNAVLGWVFQRFNQGFEIVTGAYGWTIGKAMHLAALVLVIYAGLLFLTGWLFRSAPTGFVPQQDMGRCLVGVQLPDAASLERTKEVVLQIEKIARETPGVAHTISVCGISFVLQSNGPNFGSLFIILKPFAERQRPDLTDEAIMARMRARWAKEVKDARVVVFGAAPIPGISVAGGFKVIVEDRGGLGVEALQNQTDALIGKLHDQPGLVGVSTQFRSGIPQLYMEIDWSKAAAMGLSPGDVNQALGVYLGSSYVNSFNEFGRYWQVTLQAAGSYRSDVSNINLIQVRNKWGLMVPLGTVANVREITGPIFINRYNLYTAAPMTGSLQPGASTGQVITEVDRTAKATLPRSMRADWTELMYLQILEGNIAPPEVVFSLSVLFVFLALAALYESWTLPLAVILVVPLCVLCSVIGVFNTHSSVNIFVQVGLIVLVGLACKNAILIVEFAREKHTAGAPVFEATREASQMRLRPILMTSFAFILGVVPLVYASGAGAEMRRSLGVAVFSGMLGVTAFGIFLTPVFFYVIQGFGETRLFSGAHARLTISCSFGLILGIAGGYLVGRLASFPAVWATVIGGCAGLLSVLSALGIHQRLRT